MNNMNTSGSGASVCSSGPENVVAAAAAKLRRVGLGLYIVLSSHAKLKYGRRLEELNVEELASLVEEVLPGRWKLLASSLGLEHAQVSLARF